jgi:hypothetical protein
MAVRQTQPGQKGRWTIGFIGRGKRAREASVREALGPDERVIGRYAVAASQGKGAASGIRFGNRCLLLLTSERVVAIASELPPRWTLNPLVSAVRMLVNGLVPVRKPYVLFETTRRALKAERKVGATGSSLLVQGVGSEWVIRFSHPDEMTFFTNALNSR